MKRRKKAIIVGVVFAIVALVLCALLLFYKGYETGAQVRAGFVQQLEKDGTITFRSNEGQWVGADGDFDLYFIDGGSMVMIEYGDGVYTYLGSFQINPQGVITVNLRGFVWPQMTIGRDSTSFLLVQSGGNTLDRGGTWPFRPTSDMGGVNRFINGGKVIK